jgi:virulence-associated protein VapD
MYAVTFDLDTETLQKTYGAASHNNAYGDIKAHMLSNGFTWTQGSVYFGGEKVNAVSTILTVQSLSKKYSWFQPSVRDIRMLRIEELNDLKPAL